MADETPEAPPHLSALEVRNKYGIRAGIFLALMIWFGYDGWFNPAIQAKTFNKVCAVPLALGFLFCSVMAGSAALTVMKQKKTQSPRPPSA
jgi:hypothetical protein